MSGWMKVAAMTLCAAIVTGSASAAEIALGDRIGKVLAAEASSAPCKVYNLDKSPAEVNFADSRYVVITLELTERRSISLVDYQLTLGDQTLVCIAAAHNDERFVVDSQELFAKGHDRIRLLFIADGAKLGDAAVLDGTLSTMLPGRESSVAVPVANLGNKALTPATEIPAEGKF